MAVYDKNGNELSYIYDKNGNALTYGYDRHGNVIYSIIDPTDYNFKVMTLNVQSWTGTNGWDYISPVFANYDVDVIGTQESSLNNNLVNLGYPYTAVSSSPNTNVVFSKYALSDITSKSFDSNHYAGKRGYQKMYITFNGKRVALFNAHLETSSGSMYQYPQVQELVQAMGEEEYAILTADLNANCDTFTDAQYVNVIKPFVDAGFNLSNCNKRFGINNTWTDSTGGDETVDNWAPCDNIITSSNIQIANAVVDRSKIELDTGLVIDHLPLIAYLKIA